MATIASLNILLAANATAVNAVFREVVTNARSAATGTEATWAEAYAHMKKGAEAFGLSVKSLSADGLRVMKELLTPAEQYAIEVQRLNDLVGLGAITQEKYDEALILASVAYENAIPKAEELSGIINAQTASTKAAAGGFNSMAGEVGAVAAAGYLLKGFIDSEERLVTQTNQLSSAVGLNIGQFRNLQVAAYLKTGQTAEEFGAILERVTARIGEQEFKSTAVSAALIKLGVNIKDLEAANAADQFLMLVDALSKQEDATKRNGLAMEIFGRQFKEILPYLDKGTTAFKELAAAQDEANSAENIQKLDQEAQNWRQLKQNIEDTTLSLVNFAVKLSGTSTDSLGWIGNAKRSLGFGPDDQSWTGGAANATEMAAKTNAANQAAAALDNLAKAQKKAADAVAAHNKELEKNAEDLKKQIQSAYEDHSAFDRLREAQDKLAGVDHSVAQEQRKLTDELAHGIIGIHFFTDAMKALSDSVKLENLAKGADEIKRLNEEIDKMTGNTTELLKQQGITDPAQIKQIEDLQKKIDDIKAAQDKAKKATEDAAEAQKKAAEDGKRVWEETRTPLEKYNEELANLRKLLQEGAIDQDTFSRRARQLKDGLAKQEQKETQPEKIAAIVRRNDFFVPAGAQPKGDKTERAVKELHDTAKASLREHQRATRDLDELARTAGNANGGTVASIP